VFLASPRLGRLTRLKIPSLFFFGSSMRVEQAIDRRPGFELEDRLDLARILSLDEKQSPNFFDRLFRKSPSVSRSHRVGEPLRSDEPVHRPELRADRLSDFGNLFSFAQQIRNDFLFIDSTLRQKKFDEAPQIDFDFLFFLEQIRFAFPANKTLRLRPIRCNVPTASNAKKKNATPKREFFEEPRATLASRARFGTQDDRSPYLRSGALGACQEWNSALDGRNDSLGANLLRHERFGRGRVAIHTLPLGRPAREPTRLGTARTEKFFRLRIFNCRFYFF
jgi:hypothetical protein